MTVHSAQSTYEKLTAAGLFLLAALLGWLPFLASAGNAPYVERGFLFISLAVGLLSLMLVYDAAERYVARGQGVYFAAVFCSLPATGLLLSDPGLLPMTMLLLLVSAATWFAVRAEGEQRTYMLAMLAGLLLIAGYGFQLFPGVLAFLFAVWIALLRSTHRTILGPVLLAAYLAGWGLRQAGGLTLPPLDWPQARIDGHVVMAVLPWRLYALPVLITMLFLPRAVKGWHIAALVTIVLGSAAAIMTGTNVAIAGALLAPAATLLAGDLLLVSFDTNAPPFRRWLLAIPPLLTAIGLAVFSALGMAGLAGVRAPGTVRLVVAGLLSMLLLWAVARHLPRWVFALLVAAGLWFGSFHWPQTELLPGQSVEPLPLQAWGTIAAAAAISALALYRAYYGPFVPRALLARSGFRFEHADFRRFDETGAWNGKTIALSGPDEPFTFLIFGDVTGAESPLAGRHGGYFAFRQLVLRIRQDAPQFAISLGDLATRATSHSFRRVRRLLRFVPVPLTAIPGNHDVFSGTKYDARYFQSLFGADNRAFRHGSVEFVLVNNAWGSLDRAQFEWLEAVLRESVAPFLLVFCHKPPFDLREDGSYAMEQRDHAERLHEMFRANEVTAVFSGHVHSLLSENRDGVTYVISGGGGSRMVSAGDVHHYLLAETGAGRLAIRAYPVEETGAPGRTALLELQFTPRTCSSTATANSASRSASCSFS